MSISEAVPKEAVYHTKKSIVTGDFGEFHTECKDTNVRKAVFKSFICDVSVTEKM